MAALRKNYYTVTISGTDYTYCNTSNTTLAQLATWLAEKVQNKTGYNSYAHGERVYVDVPANITLSISGIWYNYYHD
jgi:hypothetical protein